MKLLFLIILLLYTPPVQVDLPVRVVFVQPKGQTLTREERSLQDTRLAIGYWSALSPITTTLTIVDTQVISVEEDTYNQFEWSRPYFLEGGVTIFVIDNSDGNTPIMRGFNAQSQTHYKVIWTLTNNGPATIAHELGHILYSLPHQVDQPLDIMNTMPSAAFDAGVLGCKSLELLGGKCHKSYLPIME